MIRAAATRINGGEADRLVAQFARPEDRAFADERRSPGRRRQRLVVRALLRRLLTDISEIPAGPWTLEANPERSPLARAGEATYAVSTAHSGEFVACALASGPAVGIDVERHLPRAFDALAAMLGPGERDLVAVQGGAAFYRVWSLREALAKASGAGFAGVVDGGDAVATAARDGGVAIQFRGADYDAAYRPHTSGIGLALARPAEGSTREVDAAVSAALTEL